jgi:hypothetical protein
MPCHGHAGKIRNLTGSGFGGNLIGDVSVYANLGTNVCDSITARVQTKAWEFQHTESVTNQACATHNNHYETKRFMIDSRDGAKNKQNRYMLKAFRNILALRLNNY